MNLPEIVELNGKKYKKSTSKMLQIKPLGSDTVYDITVKDTHRILANGFYTSNCHHPDILDFINIKRDRSQITGANISIRFTNEFFKALEKNEEYEQRWPVEKDKAKFKKKVKAKEIWDAFIDATWDCAEPGALFWDNCTKMTPADIYKDFGFASKSTNPCFAGKERLLTKDGYKSFKELSGSTIEIINYKGEVTKSKVFSSGKKETITLEFNDGKTLTCTPDHLFKCNNVDIEAKDLLGKKLKRKFYFGSQGLIEGETLEVIKITSSGIQEVFDFTEPVTHYGIVNGFIVHNCGEIILSPYDSCRLLLINLSSFVENPFTPQANFNYDLFKSIARKAQRLMDDLVDLEIELVEKIIAKVKSDTESETLKNTEVVLWNKILEQAKKGRRTGLGVTAVGDTVAYLNMKYGSEDSIKEIEKIFKTLAISSYTESINLAKERGAFPVWNLNLEKDHPYLERIFKNLDPTVYTDYKKYGRRNISNLTIAPTGSISIMTQTTSGIEPEIFLEYDRKKKINNLLDENAKVDFIDELGDKWQIFKIYSSGVKKWMSITGETDIKKSPYYGATAEQIDFIQGIKIQAAAQRWIDHSISRTSNLPQDIDKKIVSDLYLTAYHEGCKGFTIYRKGSRDAVIEESTTKVQQVDSVLEHAPKRPEILPCEVHVVKVKGNAWVCFVSLLEDKPYEIFTGLEDNILPPKNLKQGCIIKRKTEKGSKYDLYFNKDTGDEIVFKNITHHFKNEDFGAQARLISLSLRHKIPVQFVVEQLQKIDNEDMFSFNKVISRVLKSYIKEGTRVSGSKKCPNCSSSNLAYREGCLSCLECGYSKC